MWISSSRDVSYVLMKRLASYRPPTSKQCQCFSVYIPQCVRVDVFFICFCRYTCAPLFPVLLRRCHDRRVGSACRSLSRPVVSGEVWTVRIKDVSRGGRRRCVWPWVYVHRQQRGPHVYVRGVLVCREMQCRICLLEGNQEGDPLISPCECKGSIKFVHVQCLRHWINGRLNLNSEQQRSAFFFKQIYCELCKVPYPTAIKYERDDGATVGKQSSSSSRVCCSFSSSSSSSLSPLLVSRSFSLAFLSFFFHPSSGSVLSQAD